jgi:hypothetical protein
LRIFSRAKNRRATLDPLSKQGGGLPRFPREELCKILNQVNIR